MEEIRVEIAQGVIVGRRMPGGLWFRGIPYAAPPIGAGRFRPPEPPQPWSGERDARAFGAAPPQRVDRLAEQLGLDANVAQSEDCLTVNVATPALEGALRPVMVWLHGGAFQTGTGASEVHDPFALVERGDVVVVTLNYRVGALGFLHLGGECSNLGLQDQIAALRWVRDEIARFGGDPACVTLFGESAGAGSIAALLAMPAARGLFARAILQSGAPDSQLSGEEGVERAALFAEKLGRSAEPDALRDVSIEQILDAQAACVDAGPHRTGMFFGPVLDGDTLPETALSAVRRGACAEVEIVIGTTADEMRLYLLVPGFGALPASIVEPAIATRLPGSEGERKHGASSLVTAVEELLDARGWKADPQSVFLAAETELSIRFPAIQLAEAQAAHGAKVYMYLFTWRSPMRDGELGAFHALDVPFTFGNLTGPAMQALIGEGLDAPILSRDLMDAWVAFARHGDPSHDGIPEWPPYEPRHRSTLELAAECKILNDPLSAPRYTLARLLAD